MNRSLGIASAFILLIFSGVQGVFAQESGNKPTFLPDGTVQVPAFELPPSEFVSREALEFQKSRAKMSGAGVSMSGDSNITEIRTNLERYMEPQVIAAQQRYPVDIVAQEIAGVKTRIVTPKNGEANSNRILINLHGGGFMMCAYGCAMVESIPIASLGRFKVITVDYRQGPEHTFPAATEDVIAVYKDLLKTYRPENIGVYGCSAGGSLTGQVAAWIIDKGLPIPGALGIFGAGAVRFGSGDSAYIAAYIDGSFAAPQREGQSAQPTGYFMGADMKNPLISPAGSPDLLEKFPPTLVVTGTRAMEMSPAIYTHFQLMKAGVSSNLIVGEGMGHCYIYSPDLPEALDTNEMIVKFFNDNLSR